MLTQAPKGTKDLLPQDAYRFQAVEAVEKRIAERAGYREIRTPVFEHTELFLRGVGDTTDIVQKEMYTFTDKGDRSITLKPEGTAGAVRALVEHSLYAGPLPVKMYYVNNPIFRYEDAAKRAACASITSLACEVLRRGGAFLRRGADLHRRGRIEAGWGWITWSSISIPSAVRNAARFIMKSCARSCLSGWTSLCKTCRGRFEKNPLRILDCKVESLPEAHSRARRACSTACATRARAHFEGLQGDTSTRWASPIPSIPRIVRGLDYYTQVRCFEIVAPDGERRRRPSAAAAATTGWSSSWAARQLPAMGFGMGVERVLMAAGTERRRNPRAAALRRVRGRAWACKRRIPAHEARRPSLRARGREAPRRITPAAASRRSSSMPIRSARRISSSSAATSWPAARSGCATCKQQRRNRNPAGQTRWKYVMKERI